MLNISCGDAYFPKTLFQFLRDFLPIEIFEILDHEIRTNTSHKINQLLLKINNLYKDSVVVYSSYYVLANHIRLMRLEEKKISKKSKSQLRQKVIFLV